MHSAWLRKDREVSAGSTRVVNPKMNSNGLLIRVQWRVIYRLRPSCDSDSSSRLSSCTPPLFERPKKKCFDSPVSYFLHIFASFAALLGCLRHSISRAAEIPHSRNNKFACSRRKFLENSSQVGYVMATRSRFDFSKIFFTKNRTFYSIFRLSNTINADSTYICTWLNTFHVNKTPINLTIVISIFREIRPFNVFNVTLLNRFAYVETVFRTSKPFREFVKTDFKYLKIQTLKITAILFKRKMAAGEEFLRIPNHASSC